MQERITRVIQNHLMSCQNIGKYFYILKGFDFIKDQITIPLYHYDEKHQERDALYIYEEELDKVDMSQFDTYEFISVTFNFFDEGLLQKDKHFVVPKPLDLDIKTELNVFNTINPLIGVVDDLEMDDAGRFIYMNSVI